MNTLLNLISKNSNDTIITDKWTNGQIGEIVELQNNNIFYFVHYKSVKGELRNFYKNEEEKLNKCPIVAIGIVGYWIKYRSQMSIKDMFDNYYIQSFKQFERCHREDPKLIGKKIDWIFLQYAHLREERKYINTSSKIFSYLTEEDKNKIIAVTKEYKNFVLNKYIKVLLNNNKGLYPEEERYMLFYKKFHMACNVASWIEEKYDLGFLPQKTNTEIKQDWKKLYETIPQEAADWIELFDCDMPICVDSPLMEEIFNRLEKCSDEKSRWRTAQNLILPFKDFAQYFDHTADIKQNELEVIELEKEYSIISNTTDKEQLEAIQIRLKNVKASIERYKYREEMFYKLAQNAIKENTPNTVSMEQALFVYWSSMVSYARRLAAILLRFGIDLKDVQKSCEVYLVWDMPLHSYVDEIYVSNISHAEELMKQIKNKKEKLNSTTMNNNVFIVHGHDDGAIAKVSNFIRKIGFNPIILREQPDGGQTIIEKIETYTNVCFAIILYTPCDLGKDKNVEDTYIRPRARQNVVFEHGFLCNKLGRSHVCALVTDNNIELPGDLSGVLFKPMDDTGLWEYSIAKEMQNCNLSVDLNQI